jgi:hypothetical protein
MLPGFPGANIKEFWLTILSEAKRPQTQCPSPKGEFWVCSEANSRMVQNSFQRAKGNLGNRPHSTEAKEQGYSPIKNKIYYKFNSLQKYCEAPHPQGGACGALTGQEKPGNSSKTPCSHLKLIACRCFYSTPFFLFLVSFTEYYHQRLNNLFWLNILIWRIPHCEPVTSSEQ